MPPRPVDSPFLVPFSGRFKLEDMPTHPGKKAPSKAECEARLEIAVAEIARLQRVLYASNKWGVLLVFQAMDASGKDGTIRAVLSGVDPTGCQVYSFKRPSSEELDHDFLWRTARALPERGRIGVFNRSYYEEVLVVRVRPELLVHQRLPGLGATPGPKRLRRLWRQRFSSIRSHERHLARNGMLILKFFLNVSHDEQRERLLERLDDPDRNWKFEADDLAERARWPDYMAAYEDALSETSRPWAPWYAVPADDKAFMRMTVAETVAEALTALKLKYPDPTDEERARYAELREVLARED